MQKKAKLSSLSFLLVLLCVSCTSNIESYYKKGERLVCGLSLDLESVENLEDLKKNSSKIKKKFLLLTKLMIKADEYCHKHPKEKLSLKKEHFSSDRLLYEMSRICEEYECLEYMKKLQRDSLEEFDAYQKKAKKQLR